MNGVLNHPWTKSAGILAGLAALCIAVVLLHADKTALQVSVVSLAAGFLLLFWARMQAHPGDLVEPDTVFLAFIGVYLVVPLVSNIVFEFGVVEMNLDGRMVVAAMLGIGGIAVGMCAPWGKNAAALVPAMDAPWPTRKAVLAGGGLLAIGLTQVVLLVMVAGAGAYFDAQYSETYAAEEGLGYLSGGTIFLQLGLWIITLALLKDEGASGPRTLPRAVILLAGLFALLALRIGRRRMVLETLIGLFAARHYFVRRFRTRNLAIMGALMLLLFVVVGQARSVLQFGVSSMVDYARYDFTVDQLRLVLVEPETVPLAISETMAMVPSGMNYRAGATLVEAFQILVPRAIYPNRPLAPSQWFVWQYDPNVALIGGGYSYALFAEGYLNFGMPGIFLVGFLEGLFFRFLTEFRRAVPHSKSRALLVILVLSYTVSFIRGDFATLLKTLAFSAMLPSLLIAWYLGRPTGQGRAVGGN